MRRPQICDAVALAAYLQTHLVLPVMAKNEYWKDSSKFEHIFDVPVRARRWYNTSNTDGHDPCTSNKAWLGGYTRIAFQLLNFIGVNAL
jgi:hypothetical protein